MDVLSTADIECLCEALAEDALSVVSLRGLPCEEVLEGEQGPACHPLLMVEFWGELAAAGLTLAINFRDMT